MIYLCFFSIRITKQISNCHLPVGYAKDTQTFSKDQNYETWKFIDICCSRRGQLNRFSGAAYGGPVSYQSQGAAQIQTGAAPTQGNGQVDMIAF